jgi:multidrug resistance efflux pump
LHTGQPAMTLIDSGHWMIIGNFRENALSRLRIGHPAIVAFRAMPGEFFRAKVYSIGSGVGEGQGVPSGNLPAVRRQTSWIQPAQRFQVRLVLDPGEVVPLRVGMTGSVSIYTEDESLFNDITRAWHRVVSWLYYL